MVKSGKARLPVLFRPTSGLFGFAGLCESWSREGTPVESFTILTTDAHANITSTHDRMPVIIEPADYGTWLDAAKSADGGLLRPYQATVMTMMAVSSYVNDVKHQGPRCVEPMTGGFPKEPNRALPTRSAIRTAISASRVAKHSRLV
jgi:putative SOS response-associated peptidase YedK